MADVAHEHIPTKYKLGDVTSKGTVTCVMASRHAQQSRYIVDGKTLYEWEIDDLPKPDTKVHTAHHGHTGDV